MVEKNKSIQLRFSTVESRSEQKALPKVQRATVFKKVFIKNLP